MHLFAAAFCLLALLYTPPAQPASAPMAPPAAGDADHGTPQVVKIRGGFGFLEGPACDADGNLYFVDMSSSKLYRLSVHGELDLVLENTEVGAGLMFDKDGRLFMTQFGGAKLVEVDLAKRSLVTVADAFEGKPFSNCNDLTIDSQGGIYFSDPLYKGKDAVHPQGRQSVYYASPESGGKRALTRVVENDKQPNGVLLSPDEKILYVVPAGRPALVAYAVVAPGKLGEKKEVALPGNGDGIAIDSQGIVYVALPSNKLIQEVKPDLSIGKSWTVPEGPANCEFGGPELDTLFITARSTLYSLKLGVKGFRLTSKPAFGASFSNAPARAFCELSDEALIASLKAGGDIVLFRHGASDMSQKDAPGAADREHQRNLTSQGRAQLETIAQNMKLLKISFDQSCASPMFRARDTAEIISGRLPSTDPIFMSSGGRQFEAMLTPPAGGNLLIASHANTLASIAPVNVRAVDQGCCLIYAKDDKGKFRCVAYLTPDDWSRLAKSAQ